MIELIKEAESLMLDAIPLMDKAPDGQSRNEVAAGFQAWIHKAADVSDDWFPIETAPKNRMRVLLYEGGTTKHMWTGLWDDILNKWMAQFASDDHTIIVAVTISPTHWMPLPKPPTGE